MGPTSGRGDGGSAVANGQVSGQLGVPKVHLTNAQVQEAVAVFEANHGLSEGRMDFKPIDGVPGCQIVQLKCVLMPGVMERYNFLRENGILQ